MPQPLEVTVNVRGLAVGGAGVGEVQAQTDEETNLLGITAFVPFSAPGEIVSAHITSKKKNYLETQLVRIEQNSAERVEPRCQYFMTCGGCELQHMSYEGQLSAKTQMISNALKVARIGGNVSEKVEPIRPASPYAYRRRLALHVDRSGNVGLYRASSRSVVPIEQCPVCVAEVNDGLTHLKEFGQKVQGKVSTIILESDEKGLITVLKSTYDVSSSEKNEVMAAAKECFKNVVFISGEREIAGIGRQILELPLNPQGTLSLQVPAGAFSQISWQVNLELIAKVLESAERAYGKKVLDLYSGAGNFSVPLAKAGAVVSAVESNKQLVTFGRQNAARNLLEKNLKFHNISVEQYLDSTKEVEDVDLTIADPPRIGLGPLASSLNFGSRLVLISCQLPSLTRDLRALVEAGWQVVSIHPFDMFAQTSHVEILTVLERER